MIYLRYRGQAATSRSTWDDAVRKDFADLRKAGITDPLMDEVEAALVALKPT